MPNIIGWDPSINHTGWSVLWVSDDILDADEDYMPTTRDIKLKEVGTIIPPYKLRKGEDKSGLQRYAYLSREVTKLLKWFDVMDYTPSYSLIEQPHYEHSSRGHELEQGGYKRKGINKLILSAGIITGLVMGYGIPTYLATTWEWKRDAPNNAVEARIGEYFPDTIADYWKTSDEVMATGIAMWGWRNHGRLTFERT
jgi:hypothetical protein